MNATTDSIEPPFAEVKGRHDYLFVAGFFFSVLLLFVIAYVSYVCKRSRSHPSSEFSFRTTVYDEADDDRLLRFSRGLDDDVLVTFPTFIYSDAIIPHKGDVATDTKGSGCSICLADYKPADVVRLLPECSHLFHVKCIDTWLKAHPTCPVCRNSLHYGNLGKQRM